MIRGNRFLGHTRRGAHPEAQPAGVAGAHREGELHLGVVLPPELEQRLLNTDAAAIIKVGRHLPKIRRVLRHLRLEKYSLYIEHATMNNQKIIQLEKIDSQKVPYFSMVLVRKIRERKTIGVR